MKIDSHYCCWKKREHLLLLFPFKSLSPVPPQRVQIITSFSFSLLCTKALCQSIHSLKMPIAIVRLFHGWFLTTKCIFFFCLQTQHHHLENNSYASLLANSSCKNYNNSSNSVYSGNTLQKQLPWMQIISCKQLGNCSYLQVAYKNYLSCLDFQVRHSNPATDKLMIVSFFPIHAHTENKLK